MMAHSLTEVTSTIRALPSRARLRAGLILLIALVAGAAPARPEASTVDGKAADASPAPVEHQPLSGTLYVASSLHPGRLIAVPFSPTTASDVRATAFEIVQKLQGPFDSPDLYATVPTGTTLLGLYILGDRMVVDLSTPFLQSHPGGRTAARLTLGSVVSSLLSLGVARRVRFLIQSRETADFHGHFDLTRDFSFPEGLVVPDKDKKKETGKKK